MPGERAVAALPPRLAPWPGNQWVTKGADSCVRLPTLPQWNSGAMQRFPHQCVPRRWRRTAMVRKGSPVRVRQRALSETTLQRGFFIAGAARMTTSERFLARRGQAPPLTGSASPLAGPRSASRSHPGTDAVHAGRNLLRDRPRNADPARPRPLVRRRASPARALNRRCCPSTARGRGAPSTRGSRASLRWVHDRDTRGGELPNAFTGVGRK
jgi:hypothetical protein